VRAHGVESRAIEILAGEQGQQPTHAITGRGITPPGVTGCGAHASTLP
jgi:hypothetical protein